MNKNVFICENDKLHFFFLFYIYILNAVVRNQINNIILDRNSILCQYWKF